MNGKRREIPVTPPERELQWCYYSPSMFLAFSQTTPTPLSSFDTHARWQPVTQSAHSWWSYGKIEDCEQSNCYKELRLKMSRKEWSNRRLLLLGSPGRIPELFEEKFLQRTVTFSFFYGTGSDRILWNDKGVGVPVFTNRKIKTTKKRNTLEWPWVQGQNRIRLARLTLGFLPIAAYGQTGNNSHWT